MLTVDATSLFSPFPSWGTALTPASGTATGASPGSGFSLAVRGDTATDQDFVQDIVRRSTVSAEASSATADTDLAATVSMEGDGFSATAAVLGESLAQAVDYVRTAHGDQAADTFMALVARGAVQGEITEENLSYALLQGVRFLDGAYGFAAGDNALAFFNGDLNEAMNEHFQNGLNEQFYASTWNMADQAGVTIQAAETILADSLGGTGAEGAATVTSLMDTLQGMLEETTGEPATLSQTLEALAEALQEQGIVTGPAGAARLLAQGNGPLSGASPAPGMLLDAQV